MKRVDLDKVERVNEGVLGLGRRKVQAMIHELRLLRGVALYHFRTATGKQRMICNGCHVQKIPYNYKESRTHAKYSGGFSHKADCPVRALEEMK